MTTAIRIETCPKSKNWDWPERQELRLVSRSWILGLQDARTETPHLVLIAFLKRPRLLATKRTFARTRRAGRLPELSAVWTRPCGDIWLATIPEDCNHASRRSDVRGHWVSKCSRQQGWVMQSPQTRPATCKCRAARPSPHGWCPQRASPQEEASERSARPPYTLRSRAGTACNWP